MPIHLRATAGLCDHAQLARFCLLCAEMSTATADGAPVSIPADDPLKLQIFTATSTPSAHTKRPTGRRAATPATPAIVTTVMPIRPLTPPQSSSAKSRSFSDVSDASSRPSLLTSSPASDATFAFSPPSSPFIPDRRPSFSRDSPVLASGGWSAPDPYRDITRLRMTPRGNHVLYPGATFSGTQKSGRSNYDVSVTVLDVDFQTSFLCGYLRIKGLTDDWPELTTYFDAEIIGDRYGFLTTQADYGASEHEDMTHWGRFPAFRTFKNEMRRPGLTISDRLREKRGVVFMRWKERFLVPDWKVKDINGASFAGFYYVCVEFNPHRASTYPDAPSFDDDNDFPTLGSPTSPSKPKNAGPATMTGFYYHVSSEPYQQLSLSHVPEKATPSFEFR